MEDTLKKDSKSRVSFYYRAGPFFFICQQEKTGLRNGKARFNIDIFLKRLLLPETKSPVSRSTMEHVNSKKRENTPMGCPLCRHPDVHFLKETGVWVCNHCQYTWYTIEGCGLR
jgi:hypothetical protein